MTTRPTGGATFHPKESKIGTCRGSRNVSRTSDEHAGRHLGVVAGFAAQAVGEVERYYEEAARLYNVCRSRGVECGPVDLLICAVAVRRNWTVLANDANLHRCLEVARPVESG